MVVLIVEVVVKVVETVIDVEVVAEDVVVCDVEVEVFAEEPPVKRYGPIMSARSCVDTMF